MKELRAIRRQIRGKNPVEELLRKKCDEFVAIAQMLAARGTKRFYELSRRVYGDPRDRFPDHDVDNLAIARMWASRPRARDEELVYSAEEAARRIAEICNPLLGGNVKVVVPTRLTANAAAGATRITLRKGARFSERQVRALAHHEGLWHVLTSLNGYRQPVLRCSAWGCPATPSRRRGAGSSRSSSPATSPTSATSSSASGPSPSTWRRAAPTSSRSTATCSRASRRRRRRS